MPKEPDRMPESTYVDVLGVQPLKETSLPPGSRIDVPMVQANLAKALLNLFAGTIAASLLLAAANEGVSLWTGKPGVDFKFAHDLVTNLLAAETGLLGTVLGFYFGGRAAAR